ncbi:MAG TPA: ATP-dependent helicase [Clostridiales bacterium]|nr:ATP-dependent helicase [Clostridiales bacterium]
MDIIAILLPEGFALDWQEPGDTKPLRDSRQSELQYKFYTLYQEGIYPALLYLGFADAGIPMTESVRYLYTIASNYVKALVKNPELEFTRENTKIELDPEEADRMLQSAPYLHGLEWLDQNWIRQVWKNLELAFSKEIKEYPGTAADYLTSRSPHLHPVGRVFFHLVESRKEEAPFAFLATYSAGAGENGKTKHLPLKNALVEFKGQHKKLLELLSTVNKAAQASTFIAGLVDSGEIFHAIGFNSREAYTFLKEIPLYEEAGILCRIPDWWKKKTSNPRISIQIGTQPPSRLGFDALIDFRAQLSMGGEPVTVAELEALLAESEGLAFIKGKWVEVDHEKLRLALETFEKTRKQLGSSGMDLVEAMRFQLNAEKILHLSGQEIDLEITQGQWFQSVLNNLVHPENLQPVTCGGDFKAQLRQYQEKGLSWLYYMKTLGLGACLADDMGLGKTIQVLALLNYIREQKQEQEREQERTLLVVPASLIGNWVSELERFAPSLKYRVLHPSEEKKDALISGTAQFQEDVCITTYGMLHKYEWLKQTQWDTVILDEAQAIKNPGTRQTRTVKMLKAASRIAMTGTPIENRLSDLWSLFDFLNRGLLGTGSEFTQFTKKLEAKPEEYARLKKAVSPFILRRLKTDKAVIQDLPEKVEMKTYSTLTKKQVALYSSLVEELKNNLESSGEGLARKGLILSSLLKFKQICNHPDHYLSQGGYAEEDSGKYARLREICEVIREKRERVLLFTQFREITGPLQEFLERIFGHPGLILHGGTPVTKRKDLVARFQGQDYVPFLVLSLKAGGVGLNLTSANHVIHFDRWWNPSVENQATDRAFRIGQKKNVLVHKFITKGTIEEKIDDLIEGKIQLSRDILPDAQESWITEMSNQQLMELFKLAD